MERTRVPAVSCTTLTTTHDLGFHTRITHDPESGSALGSKRPFCSANARNRRSTPPACYKGAFVSVLTLGGYVLHVGFCVFGGEDQGARILYSV